MPRIPLATTGIYPHFATISFVMPHDSLCPLLRQEVKSFLYCPLGSRGVCFRTPSLVRYLGLTDGKKSHTRSRDANSHRRKFGRRYGADYMLRPSLKSHAVASPLMRSSIFFTDDPGGGGAKYHIANGILDSSINAPWGGACSCRRSPCSATTRAATSCPCSRASEGDDAASCTESIMPFFPTVSVGAARYPPIDLRSNAWRIGFLIVQYPGPMVPETRLMSPFTIENNTVISMSY